MRSIEMGFDYECPEDLSKSARNLRNFPRSMIYAEKFCNDAILLFTLQHLWRPFPIFNYEVNFVYLPDKPNEAILGFRREGFFSDHFYFSDGILEDKITPLEIYRSPGEKIFTKIPDLVILSDVNLITNKQKITTYNLWDRSPPEIEEIDI